MHACTHTYTHTHTHTHTHACMHAYIHTYTIHTYIHTYIDSEGVKPIEIHRQMEVQYSDACVSLQQVYEWSRKFLNSTSSVTDSP